MKDTPSNYPLAWPLGFKRTPAHLRKMAAFCQKKPGKMRQPLSVSEACHRLLVTVDSFTKIGQAYRINEDQVIVSTNLKTRLDGLPYSNQKEPEDVGVAVYFEMDGQAKVLCCDKWNRIADNIAAIAATLEAMRSLERWGVTESERVFTGFALPEKAQGQSCWEILGISQTLDKITINAAYRTKANKNHPDRPGGSHEAMTLLNNARDEALNFAHQNR